MRIDTLRVPAGEAGLAKDGGAAVAAVQRVIVVSFKKKVPHGVVLWWKGLLKGDATIDVTKIAGRKAPDPGMASAWAQVQFAFCLLLSHCALKRCSRFLQAHAQFQENCAKREPMQLNY